MFNKFTTLPFLTAAASHLYWSQTLEGSCPCTLWECPPWLRDFYAPHEANLVENSSIRLFDTKFQQINVNLQFVSLNKTASIRVILIPQLKQDSDQFNFNVKLIQLFSSKGLIPIKNYNPRATGSLRHLMLKVLARHTLTAPYRLNEVSTY